MTFTARGLAILAVIMAFASREGRADFKPTPDGKITMKDWLEFGVAEVPGLYEKISAES